MRLATFIAACVLALAAAAPAAQAQRGPPPPAPIGDVATAQLPPEAAATLALIRKGGPYPYAKDGAVFGNRERILPLHARGYYREYTVKMPGTRGRGAHRIVCGGDQRAARDCWYSDDHYRSFKRIR